MSQAHPLHLIGINIYLLFFHNLDNAHMPTLIKSIIKRDKTFFMKRVF